MQSLPFRQSSASWTKCLYTASADTTADPIADAIADTADTTDTADTADTVRNRWRCCGIAIACAHAGVFLRRIIKPELWQGDAGL